MVYIITYSLFNFSVTVRLYFGVLHLVVNKSGCIRYYGFLIGPPDPMSNIRPIKSEQPGSNEAVRHLMFPN